MTTARKPNEEPSIDICPGDIITVLDSFRLNHRYRVTTVTHIPEEEVWSLKLDDSQLRPLPPGDKQKRGPFWMRVFRSLGGRYWLRADNTEILVERAPARFTQQRLL